MRCDLRQRHRLQDILIVGAILGALSGRSRNIEHLQCAIQIWFQSRLKYSQMGIEVIQNTFLTELT